jgi:hypothetical protein
MFPAKRVGAKANMKMKLLSFENARKKKKQKKIFSRIKKKRTSFGRKPYLVTLTGHLKREPTLPQTKTGGLTFRFEKSLCPTLVLCSFSSQYPEVS